jgi:hypothetical protein
LDIEGVENMKNVFKLIDWNKISKNLLIFTAPALIVFFGQLALKVDWRAAAGLALITLYGAIVDFLRKYKDANARLNEE